MKKSEALESHYRRVIELINRGGAIREMYSELLYVSLLEDQYGLNDRIDILNYEIDSVVNEFHGLSNSLRIIRQMEEAETPRPSGAV